MEKRKQDHNNREQHTNDELLAMRNFSDTIIEESPFAMWISDRQGSIIRTNRALRKLLNLTDEQLVGKYNILRDRNLKEQGLMPQIKDVFDRHETANFLMEWNPELFEESDLSGGRSVYIMASVFPILNKDKELTNVVCQWVSVTEERNAVMAVRASEAKWHSYIDNAPYGIFIADKTGRYLEANTTASLITGYTIPELLSLSIPDLLAPDDLAKGMTAFHSLIETGSLYTEIRFICKNGNIRWWSVSAVKLSEDRYLGFTEDITDQKTAEEERDKLQSRLIQAQKLEAIGRLAGGIAHDFNNKLTVILGFTEMAMEEIGPENEAYSELGEVLKAAQFSQEITHQLLTFARNQPGTLQKLNIEEEISSMILMLERLIGENITLRFNPASKSNAASIDPSQLDQILVNLCINARDAIQTNGIITIETAHVSIDEDYCKVTPDAHPGDYVLLSIRDNGCGMDAATRENIFEPFYTTKGQFQGTGLGLSTVYGIVKQSNGFITVKTEPEKGTVFCIYLPRLDEHKKTEQEPTPAITTGYQATVLLVEDEEILLNLCINMLQKLGFHVLPAASPKQALVLSENHPGEIDIMLTDIIMPEMNGCELAEKICESRPGIKTLYMSGYTMDIISQQGIINKPITILQKPFTKAKLSAKLEPLLHGDQK